MSRDIGAFAFRKSFISSCNRLPVRDDISYSWALTACPLASTTMIGKSALRSISSKKELS